MSDNPHYRITLRTAGKKDRPFLIEMARHVCTLTVTTERLRTVRKARAQDRDASDVRGLGAWLRSRRFEGFPTRINHRFGVAERTKCDDGPR